MLKKLGTRKSWCLKRFREKTSSLLQTFQAVCGTFSLPGKITNVEFFFLPRIFLHSGKILMLKTFGHFGNFYLFPADCKKIGEKKKLLPTIPDALSHERTTLEALLKWRGYFKPLKSRGQTNLLIPRSKSLKYENNYS